MKRALAAWPTVLGQTASNHGRKLIRPAQRHGRNDRFRRNCAVGAWSGEGPESTYSGGHSDAGVVVAGGDLELPDLDRPRAVAGVAVNEIITATAAGIEIVLLAPGDLPAAVAELVDDGGRMQMAYAWRAAPGRIELRYLASRGERDDFFMWRCTPCGAVPSLATISPLLGWYEREIADLFGVEFAGHPEPHRLVLHPGVQPLVPPLTRTLSPGRRDRARIGARRQRSPLFRPRAGIQPRRRAGLWAYLFAPLERLIISWRRDYA
jgi:hypothetical protein